MNEPTPPTSLVEALRRYRFAYLLTVDERASPHAAIAAPVLDGPMLVVRDLGPRTLANLRARSAVSLLWPPATADDYTLYVDGAAMEEGEVVRVQPARAVLHRPARSPLAAPAAGACAADCRVLRLPEPGAS
jgi:hypothetical protein